MTTTIYIAPSAVLLATNDTYGNVVGPTAKRIIRGATLTNTTAAAVACTVYLVPSGGTAGASNTYISARSINPGESYQCPELINKGIGPGGYVQAFGLGVTFNYTATDITNG